MNCPSCGHQNATDAAFCNKCGARLDIVCSQCRRSNSTDSAFCAGCGQRLTVEESDTIPKPLAYTPRHLAEKILRDRAALEGERRNVTVLFSDAMGFTPLSERMDAEDVYSLMQGYIARMMEAVHRYEGTITSFTGDGVMALFGAPIAHEDSARRAVAAALEMQRSLADYSDEVSRKHPIECRFRVGLNTGPVVVGKISDNLDMDYTALGDTVNLASRMEEAAEPGTVYLTEDTYRQAGDYFECEALGALVVKGKSAPVVAYRAVREKADVRTRLQAQAERGLTPFVGRSQEMNVLRGYFDQAKLGRGQVVFVTGEAGLGKSRLLHEFRRSALDEPLTWIEGHCISYGKRIPYLPVSDLIKRAFGIEEGDHEEQIVAKLEDGTKEWDDATRKTVPYLRYLLNVDPGDASVGTMDPMERRAGILDALRALLIQQSRLRPLVIVIEDLHWVDEKSEEALAAIVEAVQSTPTLMVLTYRPGYAHSLGDRTYYSRLALNHLPPEDSAAIAERLLHVSALPEPVRNLIASKGEGNPFYIEEVTRSLVESGVLTASNGSYALERPLDQVRVPDTIQEVILSRIDRLEQEAKEAIQLASVIGREFTARLLDRISNVEAKLDDRLVDLKKLELIYEKDYFPELSYMFKHALTHDVAYSTLLIERRKNLHHMVGTAIEELYADRLPEQYEALAYHYFEGQGWEKALQYLVKSGDKAVASYANQEALDHYARALEVCGRVGESALSTAAEVAQSRALVSVNLGDPDEAVTDFNRMADAARRLGDSRLEGIALAFCGMGALFAHEFEDAEHYLVPAITIGEEGFPDVGLLANVWLAELFLVTNRHEEAAEPLRRMQELVAQVEDPFTLAWAGVVGGMRPHWTGDFDEALTYAGGRSWEAARQMATTTLWNRWFESLMRGGKGEYDKALGILNEVIDLAQRVGEVLTSSRALNTIGWIYVELQDHDAAIIWNTRGLEAALSIQASDPEVEFNARLNLADSLLALGRLDEAEEQLRPVEAVYRKPKPQERFMLWRYAQHLFHTYGDLWLVRGDTERALEYAGECLMLAEQSDSRKNIVKARRLRGQVLIVQGKLAEAEPEIEMALGIAKDVGNPPQIWKTLVAVGDLRKTQGRADEAREAYAEAMSVIDRVATALEDESLRQTFLSSPHVRGIHEASKA